MPDKKLSKKIIKGSRKAADVTGKRKAQEKKSNKKLSKKVLKTSKKTGKIKGLKDLNKRMIKDSKSTKGFAPTEKPAPKSPVKSMVAAGVKNSGMRKTAKKKREAARATKKAVRTAASVGRPKRVADKEIKKVLSKRLKTKTSARGKKVVEKIDGKRYVTKYDKSGRVRKAKGMGYKTKHKAGKIVKEKGRNK
jgi:hypothetical protein